jgi:hypothetical protein
MDADGDLSECQEKRWSRIVLSETRSRDRLVRSRTPELPDRHRVEGKEAVCNHLQLVTKAACVTNFWCRELAVRGALAWQVKPLTGGGAWRRVTPDDGVARRLPLDRPAA